MNFLNQDMPKTMYYTIQCCWSCALDKNIFYPYSLLLRLSSLKWAYWPFLDLNEEHKQVSII